MALIKCSECGKEISDKAASCPNCGCPAQYQVNAQKNTSNESTATWESVYSAIDKNDMIGAAKLIKSITGASIQEARDTAILIRNNRSAANQNTKTNSHWNKCSGAVRCLKCGKLYYNDMDKCPGCGSRNSATTTTPYVDPSKTVCSACKSPISKQAETCPHCGQPTGVHVCPRCQSVNTKVISGASKATSVVLWGPFAANKVVSKYECKSCGHKW